MDFVRKTLHKAAVDSVTGNIGDKARAGEDDGVVGYILNSILPGGWKSRSSAEDANQMRLQMAQFLVEEAIRRGTLDNVGVAVLWL